MGYRALQCGSTSCVLCPHEYCILEPPPPTPAELRARFYLDEAQRQQIDRFILRMESLLSHRFI